MTYLYIKAIHIIFIVTWFAGLFYITRLFIYITEAHNKPEPARSELLAQLKLMARRLWYGITWPSAVITLLAGTTLLILQPEWLQYPFMHVKLGLVLLLYLYHFSLQYIHNLLQKDIVKYSSQQLRMWNEVATLFLVSIVFLIILKNALSMVWGLVGLLLLVIILFLSIKIYKQWREAKQKKDSF